MSNINKKHLAVSGVFFLLFIALMLLVSFTDVKAVGPLGSAVGLASVNLGFAEFAPYNAVWYNISEWCGYISLGVAFGFCLFGVWQLIKRKSLKKVDREIYLLAGLYVVTMVLYVLFDKVIVINYRPVLEDGALAASFPSSHTMLAFVIMTSAITMFGTYFGKSAKLTAILDAVCMVVLVLTVVARMVSGVHWLTDIVAGALLGTSLVLLFASLFESIESEKEPEKEPEK